MYCRTGRIRKTFHKASTYTLLDAAALATTAPLDLSDPAIAPDFTAVSFYKIFGFPNIGALIVRKDSGHVLQNRRYFGGGTVDMVISINDTWHAKKDATVHDRLEDGTLPFHSIFALDHAISVHERLYGPDPMKFISMHTAQLARKLYDGLSKMTHSNGTPVVRIYKDDNAIYGDPSTQGATIAFNVQRPDGRLVGFEEVEEAADERQIYVRSGSLCNPGGVATYLEWSPAEMRAAYAAGHRCANPQQIVFSKATGVVRISLGAMSISADVMRLLSFIKEVYVDQNPSALKLDAKQFFMAHEPRECDPLSLHALSVRSASRASSEQALPVSIAHALHITHSEYQSSTPPKPSTKLITASRAGEWTDSPTMPISASAQEFERGPPRSTSKNPPSIPSDFLNNRRPWENKAHKYTTTVEAEVKSCDRQAAFTAAKGQNTSNSVKARKFGRSVVNLLRQKSNHALADNASKYEPLVK